MKKQLVLTAMLAAFATMNLSSGAIAEPPEHRGRHHARFMAEDAAAFTNARIAALKAGLELSPAQEKNWPQLETALREIAKARAARMAEWREKGREKDEEARVQRDALAGLRQAGKALAARGAELEKLADAAKPLYESLDEAQKRRFGVLLRAVGRPHVPPHWGSRPRHDDDSGGDD